MARKVAVKRLSAVEIDPAQSHQHEFHAGRLREALDFGDEKVSGIFRVHVHRRDGTIVVDDGLFTLYDARQLTPGRSEWHLYYTSKTLPLLVEPGDLLVLFRPDTTNNVAGIVAAAGTEVERELLRLNAVDCDADLQRFLIVEPPRPAFDSAAEATQTLFADDELGGVARETRMMSTHPIIDDARSAGRIPGTANMARYAAELVGYEASRAVNPDAYLIDVMQIETSLFFEIEKAIHETRLHSILEGGGSVPEVLDWAMGVHQARRSRRGQSLQLHFARLLDVRRVPYTAQCGTEAGETPDFVMPGCREYHDAAFSDHRLRMVACKSTSKERWRQVLNEAVRISPKYLLTLDSGLSGATIDQMTEGGLLPFIPESINRRAYSANASRDKVGTVADLLRELEAVEA